MFFKSLVINERFLKEIGEAEEAGKAGKYRWTMRSLGNAITKPYMDPPNIHEKFLEKSKLDAFIYPALIIGLLS